MRYVYLDHTTEPLDVLGKLHGRLINDRSQLQVSGLLLHTCHRVEWCSAAGGAPPVPELASGTETLGARRALSRLSKIAAGVMSIIVGDRLVFNQVLEAGSQLDSTSAEYVLLHRALGIARQARQRFGLEPVIDYGDMPRTLRSIDSHQGRAPVARLVVVGGGMLAQAIALRSGPAYGNVVLVTRNTSRLHKTLHSSMDASVRAKVVSPAAAMAEAAREPFDLALTSTSTNRTYLRYIDTLTAHPNLGRALDYRATPALPRATHKYGHISDADILRQVIEANRVVADRAREASGWIDRVTDEVEDVS